MAIRSVSTPVAGSWRQSQTVSAVPDQTEKATPPSLSRAPKWCSAAIALPLR